MSKSKTSKTSKKATATTEKNTTRGKKATKKPTTKKSTKSASKTKAKKEKTKKAPSKKASPKKPLPKKKPLEKRPSKMDSEMLTELEAEVRSDDVQVCLGAVERLGVLKHPDATRVLIIALTDPRYMVRIHAAAQLGERRDKKSVDALVESLNDDSVFVRQTVAGALENIGGAKAKKAITKAEKDGLLLDELPEGKRLGE